MILEPLEIFDGSGSQSLGGQDGAVARGQEFAMKWKHNGCITNSHDNSPRFLETLPSAPHDVSPMSIETTYPVQIFNGATKSQSQIQDQLIQ
jgi:hypothetical protein